jgi:hypothetical protein
LPVLSALPRRVALARSAQPQTKLMSQLESWTAWLRHRYPVARGLPAARPATPSSPKNAPTSGSPGRAPTSNPTRPSPPRSTGTTAGSPGVLHRLQRGPFVLECVDVHTAPPEAAYADATVSLTMPKAAEREAPASDTNSLG